MVNMPSMKKVKGGYEVYNKETGKTTFTKFKKNADNLVAKGYHKKKYKKVTTKEIGFDYGGKLFDADSWIPKK